MNITFLPSGNTVAAEAGETLLSAAKRAGVLIDASCAGSGICGKCKVTVTSGDASPLTAEETALLTADERAANVRLACKTSALSDLTVTVSGLHGGSDRKKSMARLPEGFLPQNDIAVLCRKVPKATMKDQSSDLVRIAKAFERPDMRLADGVLPDIHSALEQCRGEVTAAFDGEELISIEGGDTSSECLGVAFDIGTTTVVGMLWDFRTGALIDAEARTNDQSVFGADVISRIQFTLEAPENLSLMQQKAIGCCNGILSALCARSGAKPQHIYSVAAVGNTTMSHLFLGVTPKTMSRTPFAPVFCAEQAVRAGSLGLNVAPHARVLLLPNIAGHVGSDIVGMMLAVDMDSLCGSHIAIDIGTNGEVVAIKNGRMATCSTAAGPAFEGATIRCGMRAAPGAIERVELMGAALSIKTIDGLPPIGICGSGLIDAVAALLTAGVIDKSGRMLTQEEAILAGIPNEIAKRIEGAGQGLAFRLAGEGATRIVLSQQDVREVQLAKGAIHAGILTLMGTLGMQLGEIDSILLAGAFGNYIRRESALKIGLLPKVDVERIIPVGNAAGAGASMALLNDASAKKASALALATEHVELSMNMDFQEHYIAAMTF